MATRRTEKMIKAKESKEYEMENVLKELKEKRIMTPIKNNQRKM